MRERPSGTVTFMFTDVEGSTALWDGAPAEMAVALARHDELVRSSVAAHGGFVFSTAGDGFGVAFASVASAAKAAATLQAQITREPWPGEAVIRVRVGLHTGNAVERDGDYFGTAVNRAARVASLGRGGQVVVSRSTSALLADEDWVLVNAGVHRLDGIERPEQLHRLVVPGLVDVDLPLRGQAGLGNLPKRRGRLIGRAAEVDAVTARLRPGELVSIVGVGGVGKTRLALAAAEAMSGRFRDGAWLVELAAVVSPDDVGAAVATALRIQVVRDRSAVEAVVATLADQERVIVLDNCEHVLDAVVDLVERLGHQCGRVAVLTTTREALGLPDEQVVSLRPLQTAADDGQDTSAAATLFHERARSAVGSFEPSAEDRAVVERVCRRLDGLPLAIELAAARMPMMSLGELERRLDERFGLLTRRRGAIERHQSLRTTVSWSYDHLDAEEQVVFDCLSVFSGSFDIDAVGAVIVDDAVAALEDVVASLVAKSMLTVQHTASGTRFQQLETLRQFGEERLEHRGVAGEVHRRHLEHVVRWSQRASSGIEGRDEVAWNHAFNIEWHNVRSALRWACDIGDGDTAATLLGNVLLWAMLRMRLEAAGWIDDVLQLTPPDDARRPTLLGYAAVFANTRADQTRANELLAEASAEDDRLGRHDPWISVAAGTIERDLHRAIAAVQEAQQRGHAYPYMGTAGRAQEAMMRALLLHRDRPPASTWQAEIERIRSLLDACEAFGNPGLISHAGTGLGLAMIQRDPELAAEQLQHALDLAIAVDIEYSTWQTRCHLAGALTRLGRHREALELLAPDIQRHIRAGSSWFAWFQIRAGVDPLVGIGATDLAADLLDALEAHGYPVDELAQPRRRIGHITEGTEGTPIRRRALTVAEAAAAIHHAVR